MSPSPLSSFLNLTDAEGVAMKTMLFCFLSVMFLATVCACMLLAKPIEGSIFIMVATFVCAIGGISYGSFLTQRLTDYGYVERKGEAQAKVAEATKAPPAAPATVITQPPAAAVEIHS